VAQALRVQVDALDNRFLVLTASIETTDLPELKQLADLLARIDAHFAVAAVSETTLNQALLGLRTETLALRGHVTNVQAAVTGIPIFEPITVTKALHFMLISTRMLIARMDHALPSGLTPPSDL
jgi:hypothetical protein